MKHGHTHHLIVKKHPPKLEMTLLKWRLLLSWDFSFTVVAGFQEWLELFLKHIPWVFLSSPNSHSPKLGTRDFTEMSTDIASVHWLTENIIAWGGLKEKKATRLQTSGCLTIQHKCEQKAGQIPQDPQQYKRSFLPLSLRFDNNNCHEIKS